MPVSATSCNTGCLPLTSALACSSGHVTRGTGSERNRNNLIGPESLGDPERALLGKSTKNSNCLCIGEAINESDSLNGERAARDKTMKLTNVSDTLNNLDVNQNMNQAMDSQVRA